MYDASSGWATSGSIGAILRTTDGGLHWRDVTPRALIFRSTYPVPAFLSPTTAWIAVTQAYTYSARLVHTADGGTTWSSVYLPRHVMDTNIRQILFVDAHDGWAFAASDGEAGSQEAEVFHTADGGRHWVSLSYATWQDASPGSLPYGGWKIGLGFRTKRDGFATWGSYAYNDPLGLFVTHDAGRTWYRTAVPPVCQRACGFSSAPQFFTNQDGVISVVLTVREEAVSRFLVTHDGGRSWHLMPFHGLDPTTVWPWDFLDAQHAWITLVPAASVRPASLARTQDGGQHWTVLMPNVNVRRITLLDFVTPCTGFAVSRAGVLIKTTDGGATWIVLHAILDAKRGP
jgi:photosystem II stability/assembly factor-like uncharacterized protein